MDPRTLFLPLLLAPLPAAELTLREQPFRVVRSFACEVVPEEVLTLTLEPDAWSDFVIEEIAAHGAKVTEGEVVLRFSDKSHARRLEDLDAAIARAEAEQRLAALACERLEHEHALELARLERAKAEAAGGSDSGDEQATAQLEAATLALDTASREFPLRRSLAGLERDRWQLDLDRLREERELNAGDAGWLSWSAPAAGRVLHGVRIDGSWNTDGLAELLEVGGQAPLHRPLLSVVPEASPLRISARVEPGLAYLLEDGQQARFVFPGGVDPGISGEVAAVTEIADRRGLQRVDFRIDGPLPLVTGSRLVASVVIHDRAEALVVPVASLHSHPEGGTSVAIKLADGGTEAREVETGRRDGASVEILSGLEAGQVIVTPDE